jgi:hypothetical protein
MEYHPQTEGQKEKKNQFGPLWSRYLLWVEFDYIMTPHSATGYTPYMLMHGREARSPLHDLIPIPADTQRVGKKIKCDTSKTIKRRWKKHVR